MLDVSFTGCPRFCFGVDWNEGSLMSSVFKSLVISPCENIIYKFTYL